VAERVTNILQKMQSELAQWNSTKLSAFAKQQTPPLDDTERLELVRGLCKRDIFLWLDYISVELKSLASLDPQYIDVLSEVVNRVRHDMAQGPIIHAMTSVGESNPQLGIDLSSAMRERDDEGLVVYSSFPLGGAGRTDFNRVKPILDELSPTMFRSLKYASRAVGVPNRARDKNLRGIQEASCSHCH